jgi:hypothetical protein
MLAKVIPISKHWRYEHAYLTVYKKWIESRRNADYKARGWALEPVPLMHPNSPSLISIYCYSDLIGAYRTKLEVDTVTASAMGKVVQKPEIFSNDILRRSKLLDEAIARNFGVDEE